MKIRIQMTTEKKNYNFTLNINYLLYTLKSISFSHKFEYYRRSIYSMLRVTIKLNQNIDIANYGK